MTKPLSTRTLLLFGALVAAIVTAAVTKGQSNELDPLPGDWRPHLTYKINGDNHDLWKPSGFPTKAECEAFVASDEGQSEFMSVDMAVLMNYGGERVGGPTCKDRTRKSPA